MRTAGRLFFCPRFEQEFEKEERKNERKRGRMGGDGNGLDSGRRKRPRTAATEAGMGRETVDFFDVLPDDLIVSILSKLSSSADSPSDFVNVLITCKRLNGLAFHRMVLSQASAKSLAIKAKNWSDSAHRFLKQCADAGNLEAYYILGMIRFYCLQARGSGASLMARAAIGSHAAALYSLAVIQFNGSGGSKNDKDLRAGVALCARAAFSGHVDALRELGHCLQDGYGIRQNVAEGRRFLIQANARELSAVISSVKDSSLLTAVSGSVSSTSCSACSPLLSDYGWSLPAPDPHPANKFLVDWFTVRNETVTEGLRLCSHAGCGRPETRRHEFRRCSVCGTVNYCSRACQALDWKLGHKAECVPLDRWLLGGGDVPVNGAVDGMVALAVDGGGGEMD